MDLTSRQSEILRIIQETLGAQGYPPTVREIGMAVGLSSPASVQNHLTALEEKGYIRRGASKRRAIEVVGVSSEWRGGRDARGRSEDALSWLPLVGRVAAGAPLLADENVEESVQVPGFLANGGECFVLRVRGDSMVNAGILNGDLVVVRRQESAENGDIVVALLGEEATLKRFFKENGHVRLQPENEAMKPIITRDPRIVGILTGVMRRV
ncbi:MAG TPA: transcriptional repressor LexA [Thermoleophilia bacterium]|nr:transcriptional repressor LexA [Thermoleophilia bacterium]